MKNKIVLITGANRGLGLETAKQLAKKGATLLLVGRNLAELLDAQRQVISFSSNENVHIFIADLSSHEQIKVLSEQIHGQFERIDVLLNNAGAVFADFGLTVDGLERTIGVDHFSYFLLSYYLLDLLKKSEAGRIINVASDSHYAGKIDFESFTQNKGYFVLKAYEQAKLANVLFTFQLAEKLKDTKITVNALHPGRVKTEIGNRHQPWYISTFWSLFIFLTAVSVKKGAETQIYLASSPEVNGISGKYYSNSKQKKSSKLTFDITLREKLWKETERLTNIKFL
jgi:NAD(P)-dependent dehydrogenase (short-subunit alcohol dehydrogenase family)